MLNAKGVDNKTIKAYFYLYMQIGDNWKPYVTTLIHFVHIDSSVSTNILYT